MDPKSAELDARLDMDQKKVLFVYSLYSNELKLVFLQYTAILVICFYLMKKGLFPNYKDQLLVYDYKNSRRYLWEDKKFMADINILRDHDTLIRARARSKEYRDVNSHQCSTIGQKFLDDVNFANSPEGQEILKLLNCKCGNLYQVILEDQGPFLRCSHCKSEIFVENFLYDLHKPITYPLKAFFVCGDVDE
ncbi:MAG: hypothetical protein ACFFC7_33255 [Candidatus Hermodarchaeota archaeon]